MTSRLRQAEERGHDGERQCDGGSFAGHAQPSAAVSWVGREPGQDPYLTNLYAVDLSGEHLARLTPADTNHHVTLSPDASVFLDVASTATEPEVSTLRDTRTGAEIMPLARQDISALLATGWKPPTPFRVKGRDGTTDLYGFLYQPTMLDPAAHYPLVDYIYPGRF